MATNPLTHRSTAEEWSPDSNSGPDETKKLLAQLELLGHCLVPIRIGRVQVIKQAAALAYHHQQAPTRTVIFLIRLQMLRQPVNPVGQQSHLDISRTGILFMQ